MENLFDLQCPLCGSVHDLYAFDITDNTPRPGIRVRKSEDGTTVCLLIEPGQWIALTPVPFSMEAVALTVFCLSLNSTPLGGTPIWCAACGYEAAIEAFDGGKEAVEALA